MSGPRVSVLMPVREARWLAEALGTLLRKRPEGVEVVLVDDARTGADRDGLSAEAARHGARVVPAPPEGGLARILNAGLAACTAPLIARADADDRYAPDRLARQAAAMAARPGLVALSAGYRRIDAGGRPLWRHRPETDAASLALHAMLGAPLLHPGAMIRADALRAVGGYDPALWTAQDSDLWIRLSRMGALGNLPEPLVDWREHGASVGASRGAAGRALSHGIAARAVEAFLGAPWPEADAALDLWRGTGTMGRAGIVAGERGLARIARAARARGPGRVARRFERRLAAAMWRRARTQPAMAPLLVLRAAAWAAGRGPGAQAAPAPGVAAEARG